MNERTFFNNVIMEFILWSLLVLHQIIGLAYYMSSDM